ncbi:hypothetical protein [Cohnella sp.]
MLLKFAIEESEIIEPKNNPIKGMAFVKEGIPIQTFSVVCEGCSQ